MICWRTDDISKAFIIAYGEKKILFLYLYFKPEEIFPIKYNKVLSKYSVDRVVFVEIFVRVDSKGEIADEKIRDFYVNGKIPPLKRGMNTVASKNTDKPESGTTTPVKVAGPTKSISKINTAFILDPYGNLLDKLTVSNASAPIIAAIDRAIKKMNDMERDINLRWSKIKKMKSDFIKELNSFIRNNSHVYDAILNAQQELKRLNKPFEDSYKEIIKKHYALDVEKRDNNETISRLEVYLPDCGDLPIEPMIKDRIAKLKKDETRRKTPRANTGDSSDETEITNTETQTTTTTHNAPKKTNENDEKNANINLAKIRKMRADFSKELNSFIKNSSQGYEAVMSSQRELNRLNMPFEETYNEIMKQYFALEVAKRDNNATIKQLEDLLTDCEDLPIGATIKEAIAKIKKGESPQIYSEKTE